MGLRSPSGQILLAHGLFDAIHLVLVTLAIAHCTFLGLLQGRLQGLDPLHRCPQTFLQLGQFTAQIGIVPHQLLVHLGQLFQVVLEEGDLLLLG